MTPPTSPVEWRETGRRQTGQRGPNHDGLRCLCLLVLVGGFAISGTLSVVDPAGAAGNTATATFEGGDRTDQRGDVVTVLVSVQGTDRATLTFGATGLGYRTNVTVRDGNGDGRVEVAYNTYTAGSATLGGATVFTTGEGDAVTSVDPDQDLSLDVDQPRESILAAGTYPIRITAGTTAPPATSGSPDDEVTLALQEVSADGLRTWTAPASELSGLQTARDVARLRDAGALEQTTAVTRGDLIVFELSASGLSGALAAEQRDGGAVNATDAFLNRTASHASAATPDTSGSDANAEWDLRLDSTTGGTALPLNHSTLDLLPDASADTYYLVYDTSAADGLTAGHRYETVGTILATNDLTDENQAVNAQWRLWEPKATLATDGNSRIDLGAATVQTIQGTTNVTAGSTLTVRVRGTDPGNRFQESLDTTVESDGSFSVTADMSDRSVGSNYTVDVTHQGQPISRSVPGQFSTGASFDVVSVTPDRASLSQGEPVTVSYSVENTGHEPATKAVDFRVNGSGVGSRNFDLSPGEEASGELVYDTGGDYPGIEISVLTPSDTETATVDLTTAAPATVSATGVEDALVRLPGGGTGPIHTGVYRVTVRDAYGDRIRDGSVDLDLSLDGSGATLAEVGTTLTEDGRAAVQTDDAFADGSGTPLGDPATDLDGTVTYDAGDDETTPGTFYVFAESQADRNVSATVAPVGPDDAIEADEGTVRFYPVVDAVEVTVPTGPVATGPAVTVSATPVTATGTRIEVERLGATVSATNTTVATVTGAGTATTDSAGRASVTLDPAVAGTTGVEAVVRGARGTSHLKVEPATATLWTRHGGSQDVRAADGQGFFGETNLPAGTPVVVQARSAGNNPLLETTQATVDRDGEFVAVGDFADNQAGTNYTVVVNYATKPISPVYDGTLLQAPASGAGGSFGGSGSAAPGVSPGDHSFLRVLEPSLSAQTVDVGESVVATVAVRNDGVLNDTRRLALKANGRTVATTTVSVDVEGSTVTTVEHDFEVPGEYALAVNGTTVGTVTVSANATEAEPRRTGVGGASGEPTDTSAQQTATGATGGLGVSAGLGLALAGILLLVALGSARTRDP